MTLIQRETGFGLQNAEIIGLFEGPSNSKLGRLRSGDRPLPPVNAAVKVSIGTPIAVRVCNICLIGAGTVKRPLIGVGTDGGLLLTLQRVVSSEK